MSEFKIVYEDEYVIVVDKPSGLLTVATPKKEKWTLSSLLGAYPAHRLDRDTSGLILFAKTKQGQQFLMDQFRQHKVKKEYIAFVQGRIKQRKGLISGYVKDNPFEAAKYARSQWTLLEARNGFSVVRVIPITGRTNQIRIHFKQIGHPLVGERRFAFARDYKIRFRRVALHASDLEFRHPVWLKKMSFHCELANDMQEFLMVWESIKLSQPLKLHKEVLNPAKGGMKFLEK